MQAPRCCFVDRSPLSPQSAVLSPQSKKVFAVLLLLLAGCRKQETPKPAAAATPVPSPAPIVRFEEKTDAVGIHFVHVNGARGEKWMPETMGGGVAVLDFDGDGKPDLLFVSGCYWPGDPRQKEMKSSLALYRNEGVGPDGLPHFRDVTREAGLERVFYGMGAAVGDYDNDGRPDVYVTALDRNYLFHNLGGRFEEVATKAGVRDSGWGTSAAWLDFDGDGLLDLFVCRYVDWSPKKDLFCTLDGAGRARGAMGVAWGDAKNGRGSTLAIGNFSNELKSLYWTEAGDVFLDESPRSGVGPSSLLALTFGVFFFDADLDGRLDLFLANGHVEPTVQEVQKDVAYRQPPILYVNRGEGRFERANGVDLSTPLVAR